MVSSCAWTKILEICKKTVAFNCFSEQINEIGASRTNGCWPCLEWWSGSCQIVVSVSAMMLLPVAFTLLVMVGVAFFTDGGKTILITSICLRSSVRFYPKLSIYRRKHETYSCNISLLNSNSRKLPLNLFYAPPNFVVLRKICFKHMIKPKCYP